jgi:hypothetical protein
MKANENLMVGDWVKFKSSDLYHQVKVVSNKSIKFDNQKWFAKSSVEPISLTPEILEKNGFLANRHVYPYPYYEYEVKESKVKVGFAFPQGNRTSYKNPWVCIDTECVYIEHLPCIFVHQLQHALRLAGVEKEITI